MADFLKVCAVIDAQGFTVDKVFYPREVAVISHFYKQSSLCNTGLSFKAMSPKERRTNIYIANNLLGLSLGNVIDTPKITSDGEQMLVIMYNKVKTERKKYVAIKNMHLIPILEKWNIPYINLENHNIYGLSFLKMVYEYPACHFHEREVPDEGKLLCAEQKVSILWAYINDFIKYRICGAL